MDEKIAELRKCYQKLFDREIWDYSYIEVINREEILLSANKEGLLVLIDELITLCEKEQTGSHYHLDEAGMANKCEKPIVIQLIKAPR